MPEKLNLPPVNLKITERDGMQFVYDVVRKKEILLTSEEWVRQHFLSFLIREMKYPKSLIRIESGHKTNSLQKRTDILVYNNSGKPALLVECKAPTVKIDEKTTTQILIYNKTINAAYIVITNGIKNFCFEYDRKIGDYKSINFIPEYGLL